MKKLVFSGLMVIGLLFLSTPHANAQETNDIKLGVGLIYGNQIENLGIRADGYYRISDEFRAGAALGYFFPDDVGTAKINYFEIDFNGNYIFNEDNDLMFYGLAGLNLLIQTVNFDAGGSDSQSELGLNLGGGLEYQLDFGAIFGELKFAGLGGDADQLVLGGGLRFSL